MIKKFIITNSLLDTLELELEHPEKTGIYVKDVTGLGYPNSNVSITSLATSDIGHFNQSIYQSRNVVFTFGFISNVENNRQKIYDVFPPKIEVEVKIITDIKTVYCKGIVETCEPNIFNKDETIQVSLICPNPYLIDKNPIKHETIGSQINVISRRVFEQGYKIEISAPYGIDNIKIEYKNGSIFYGSGIYKDLNSDEIANSIKGGEVFLIDTELSSYGIYVIKENGNREEITDKCEIIGDFPVFKAQNNSMNVKGTGIYETEMNKKITYLASYKNARQYLDIYENFPSETIIKDTIIYSYNYSKDYNISPNNPLNGKLNSLRYVIQDNNDSDDIKNIIGYIDIDWKDLSVIVNPESYIGYQLYLYMDIGINWIDSENANILLRIINAVTNASEPPLEGSSEYQYYNSISYRSKFTPNDLYEGLFSKYINDDFYTNFESWFFDLLKRTLRTKEINSNVDDVKYIGMKVSPCVIEDSNTYEKVYENGNISDQLQTKITFPNYHDGL